MALKDLTQYLIPELELAYKGKTYTVPPPTKEEGRKLAAVNALGMSAYLVAGKECPACGREGKPELSDGTKEILEAIKDEDIAAIALSRAVYDEMVADDMPGPHIDRLGMYALYYWTLGEQAADATFASSFGGPDALGEVLGLKAKATAPTSTPKPGPRTESESRTGEAFFRPTEEPPSS